MLARIFEAVVWYETGMFATQLVDPVTLSYKKLKTILECRGLGYSGLAEKKDVSELVEKSGKGQGRGCGWRVGALLSRICNKVQIQISLHITTQ